MRILIFLLGMGIGLGAWAADNAQVFVLHSYSQEYPWTKRQHEGFIQELQSGAVASFQTSVEYLDTKRVAYSPAHAAQIAEALARKYQGYQPAVVYVSDDNALSFALTYLGRIFPGAPVFFPASTTMKSAKTWTQIAPPGSSNARKFPPTWNW